ncbi:hypothetical protein HGRIS_007896 [Hohenbuehelia grisea]|uniref:BZIP domain-containing protein n=1 Tax=Hohenbuehelia grisea TaxID=104357 RepID=A0ABR3J6R5_9AGAR
MPKSSPASPPAGSLAQPQSPSDEHLSRKMSDVALRKKKNADAQAAFRARRANYISTLEETVTSLESVVLQLQDSCREARTENAALKKDNARLRHDSREREKFWRALWQAKKTGHGPELDDLPPLPPAFMHHSQPSVLDSQIAQPQMNNYHPEGMAYRPIDDPSMCNGQFTSANQGFQTSSPAVPYVNPEDIPGDDTSRSANDRMTKYHYTYSMSVASGRDGAWPQQMSQSGSSGGESGGTGNHSASQSPGFITSPMTTPELGFVRFPMEEQKVPLSNLDAAPYVFPSSRSLSPTSTPPSSSSTSLSSTPFHFNFPSDSALAVDRTDYEYRRSSLPHCGPEMTLHGGTADISLGGPGSDAVRYRLGAQRKPNHGTDRPLLPALPPLAGPEHGAHNDRHNDRDAGAFSIPRLRPRRGTAPARLSRSPSPPALSGTLAVIKAQAFGALRRSRVRSKKPSESSSRASADGFDASGLGAALSEPPSSKRPRLNHDINDIY